MSNLRIAVLITWAATLAGACGSGVDSSRLALRERGSGRLIYAGPYWLLPDQVLLGDHGDCDAVPGGADGRVGFPGTSIYNVEYALDMSCDGAPDNLTLDLGLHSLALAADDAVELTHMVMASRDGRVAVEDVHWNGYLGLAADAPEFSGALAGDRVELGAVPDLDGGAESWALSYGPLNVRGSCLQGTVAGGVTGYDTGTRLATCTVSGAVFVVPVDVREGTGTLYIDPVAD